MGLRLLLVAVLVFLFKNSFSQYYVSGVENPNIKWEQIETRKFKLIYPSDFRIQALEISTYIDNAYEAVNTDMHPFKGKFEIIFRTHTVQSNGMVAWTPKRAEFYVTPPAEGYSQNWIKQLLLHELRHVGQLNQLNDGVIRSAYPLMGQQNIGAVSAHFPSWVLEGDAVLSETKLSVTGRGRSPEFFRKLRTQLLDSKMWKYDNSNLGSFVTKTISQYELGYPIMSYVTANSTTNPSAYAFNYISHYPYNLLAIDIAFKKSSGMDISSAFDQTTLYLNKFWSNSADTIKWDKASVIYESDDDFKDYRFPYVNQSGEIVALKSLPREPLTFVIIKNGVEKTLFVPTHGNIDNVSYSNNTIVWSGRLPGISYDYDDYSDVFSYNFVTKKHNRLTRYKHYQSASISKSGNFVVAVNYMSNGASQLVILNSRTGRTIKTIDVPKSIYIQKPSISDDGNSIAATFIDDNGKGITVFDVSKSQWQTIIESQDKYLNRVVWNGDNLLFEGDFKGVENLYSIDIITKQLALISKVKFAAIDGCFTSDSTLVYSSYSAKGFRIAKLNTNYAQEVSRFVTDKSYYPFAELLAKKSPYTFEVADTTFKPRPYIKFLHSVKVHSWMPAYADIDDLMAGRTAIYPGAALLSQNLMSSTIISGAVYYKERDIWANINLTYNGWPIKIEAGYELGGRQLLFNKKEVSVVGTKNAFKSSFTLPLNFTDGNRFRMFKPYVHLSYDNTNFIDVKTNSLHTGLLDYNIGFLYSDSRATAKADIMPSRGKYINIGTIGTLNTSTFGKTFYTKIGVYTPGFMQNHSMLFNGGYSKQNTEYYLRASILPIVRGELSADYFLKELYTASANYTFPIWHPDTNILGLLYIKRFRANVYYDWAYATTWKSHAYFNTFGVELNVDFNVFRTKVPINAGFRAGHLLHSNTPSFELLYGIRFDGLK